MDHRMTPDEVLMHRAQAGGDQQAFEELFLRYCRSVLFIAYSELGSRQDAEDVVQDVFLNLWKGRITYTPDAAFKPWLYQAVRNRLSTVKQRMGTRGNVVPLNDAERGSVVEALDRDSSPHLVDAIANSSEVRHVVADALKKLSEEEREILFLRFYMDCSYKHIAEHLSKSEAAVRQTKLRAIRNLREQLAGQPEGSINE